MSDPTITVPNRTPAPWMNRSIGVLLKTPGLQSWLGRQLALITFTGHRSGRHFTTPVTYYRDGNTVLILTKRSRNWWRNFPGPVTLRLGGETVTGRAEAVTEDEAKIPLLTEYLRNRPRDARAYGVTLGPRGEIDAATAQALAPQLVPIRILLD